MAQCQASSKLAAGLRSCPPNVHTPFNHLASLPWISSSRKRAVSQLRAFHTFPQRPSHRQPRPTALRTPGLELASHHQLLGQEPGAGPSGRVQCRAAVTAGLMPDGSTGEVAEDPSHPFYAASTLGSRLRAVAFYVLTFFAAIPAFLSICFMYPLVMLIDRHRRKAMHVANNLWAICSTAGFYRTEVEGWENLPPDDEAAVYVANHQSFLDIYTLFQLGRPFKFVSKTSNFLIPIIGWAMFLTGHVPLKRMDTRSQMKCLTLCRDLLKLGVPIVFFPEGTRTKDNKLAPFKKGAFSVAAKTGVPVVPVTLLGTGALMPNGKESSLQPGVVRMIVHPPLKGNDTDDLRMRAEEVITNCLKEHGYTDDIGYPSTLQ